MSQLLNDSITRWLNHPMAQSPEEKVKHTSALFRWRRRRLMLSLRYLFTTEVHAYAFSIAANALLSFFPFALILLTVCQSWLHWESAYQVILELLKANLPTGADFVIHSLVELARARERVKIVSVLMLFFTSSGVFLPLEIALNKVWGIAPNRSFARNLGISFMLALGCGVLAMFSITLAAALRSAALFSLGWFPWQRLGSALFRVILELISIPLIISIYFLIYYFLPNGRVPVMRVLPAAGLAGVLTEIAKIVYTLTLPMFGFRQIYGPFSLSATLLFWAFVGSLILLWGAHFSAQVFFDYPATTLESTTPGAAAKS